ncbi:MAG: hypothetical protein HY445_03165 [Candidatus Niyogibacteria bacterium]|nr:hypothetical protein [Candidatus Niyogibacteria bacterium]
MKYRISVNIPIEKPEEKKLVQKILDIALQVGAGKVGNYSRVAMILYGYETWKSGKGSRPYKGTVGKITEAKSVRIEMQCPKEKLIDLVKKIRKVHLYEESVIEIIKLEEVFVRE